MPYKNPEDRRAYDQRRYEALKARGEHPENPLTPDQWRSLQRATYQASYGCWLLLRKVAEVWEVEPFR